jgi:hypothetical protein
MSYFAAPPIVIDGRHSQRGEVGFLTEGALELEHHLE